MNTKHNHAAGGVYLIDRNALALFAGLLLIYLLTFNGQFTSIDELNLYSMVESMVQTRRIDTPQINFAPYHNPVGKHEIGFPLLATPLYWLSKNTLAVNNIYMLMLLNPVLVALTALFIYLSARQLGHSATAAQISAVAYGLGSFAWAYALSFYREPLVGFLWAMGIYGLISWRITGNKWLAGVGALAIVLSPVVKVNIIFSLPFLFLIFAKQDLPLRKRAYTFWGIAASATILIMFPFLFQWRTGGAWDFFAFFAHTDLRQISARAYGQLLSPIKGLIYYAPLIVLAALGFHKLCRKHLLPALAIALVFISLLGATSFYEFWYGGQSWGPRLLVPVLPLLFIPMATLWDQLQQRSGRVLILILLLISIVVQAAAVTNPWSKGHIPFNQLAVAPENSVGLSFRYLSLSPPWILVKNWQVNDLTLLWLQSDTSGIWHKNVQIGAILLASLLATFIIWKLPITPKFDLLLLVPVIPAVVAFQIMGGNIAVGYPGLSPGTAQEIARWVRFNKQEPYTLVTMSNEFHIYFYTGLLKGDYVHHWYSPNQPDDFEAILENTKGRWLSFVANRVHIEPIFSGKELEWWLNKQLYRFDSEWFEGYELIRYAIIPADNWIKTPIHSEFGPFRFVEVAINRAQLFTDDLLGIQLQVCKLADVVENQRIFLHLLKDGEIIEGLDGPVHYGGIDVNQWETGECLLENRGIYVPPGASAGIYDLIVGVYTPFEIATVERDGELFTYDALLKVAILSSDDR
jgi:hypothetical protein